MCWWSPGWSHSSELLCSSCFSPAWAFGLLSVRVRVFSEEWALMSLQRAVALLGMREGWPGIEDLDEVVTAVVLSFNPPAALSPLVQAQQLSHGA